MWEVTMSVARKIEGRKEVEKSGWELGMNRVLFGSL